MKLLMRRGDFIAAQFDEGGNSFLVIATSAHEFVDILFSKVMGGEDHCELKLDLDKDVFVLKRFEENE